MPVVFSSLVVCLWGITPNVGLGLWFLCKQLGQYGYITAVELGSTKHSLLLQEVKSLLCQATMIDVKTSDWPEFQQSAHMYFKDLKAATFLSVAANEILFEAHGPDQRGIRKPKEVLQCLRRLVEDAKQIQQSMELSQRAAELKDFMARDGQQILDHLKTVQKDISFAQAQEVVDRQIEIEKARRHRDVLNIFEYFSADSGESAGSLMPGGVLNGPRVQVSASQISDDVAESGSVEQCQAVRGQDVEDSQCRDVEDSHCRDVDVNASCDVVSVNESISSAQVKDDAVSVALVQAADWELQCPAGDWIMAPFKGPSDPTPGIEV